MVQDAKIKVFSGTKNKQNKTYPSPAEQNNKINQIPDNYDTQNCTDTKITTTQHWNGGHN